MQQLRSWKRNALALFLLVTASCAAQSTYYFDYVNGDNSRTAAQAKVKATPWKTHPAMGTCNGSVSAPSYSHVAGDKFYFKGGVVWPNACFQMYMDQWGGSSTSIRDYYGIEKDGNGVITWYDSGSSEPGCSAPSLVVKSQDAAGNAWNKTLTLRTTCQPVFDAGNTTIAIGSGDSDRGFMVWSRSAHIQIDNIEMRHLVCPGYQSGCKMLVGSDASDTQFTHLYLHGIKVDTLNISTASRTANVETVVTTTAHHMVTGNFVVVRNTGTSLDTTCSDTNGACSIVVDSPTQYHFSWSGANVGATSAGQTFAYNANFFLDSPGVADTAADSIEIDNSENNTGLNVANSVHGVPISNSVVHDAATMVLAATTYVRNSVWYNACWCPSGGVGGNCNVPVANAHTNGFYQLYDGEISRNLVYNFACNAAPFYPNPHADNACSWDGVDHNVYIFDNIYKAGPRGVGLTYVVDANPNNGISTDTCDNLYVWNNTFENPNIGDIARSVAGRGRFKAFVWQNNHTITSDGTGGVCVNATGCGSATTLTTNHDVNQTITAASGQGYTDANDYSPTSGGSTIDAGTCIGSPVLTDYMGNPFPGTACDAGAYEFGGSSPGSSTKIRGARFRGTRIR
jgi:hypothetical protein